MRAGSVARVWMLSFLCALSAVLSAAAQEKPNVDQLLLKAFKAHQDARYAGGNPAAFEEVLKVDPENYYALIQLGLMKLKEAEQARQTRNKNTPDAKTATDPRSAEREAMDYFLRAAIARPTSPEALLYLAQLSYGLGYVPEGDAFIKRASGVQRQIAYEALCLEGKRFEDAKNYHAAIRVYSNAALAEGSQFKDDPFLINRLYMSCLLAFRPYHWVYDVLKALMGEKEAIVFKERLRQKLLQKLADTPDLWSIELYSKEDRIELVIQKLLREHILETLAALVKDVGAGSGSPVDGQTSELVASLPEKFKLPTDLSSLFFCSVNEIPPPPYSDPYEAFVKASPETEAEHQRLLEDLEALRKEAAKVVAGETDEVEKAKKLFRWLKRQYLVTYNVPQGYSAKAVLDERKYLCLSGAILYTLLARDVKLPVNGVIVPGHAYAVLDSGRNIRVETTKESAEEGFDYKPSVELRQKETLQRRAYEVHGPVPDVMKFVAYQFANAAGFNKQAFILNHEKLLREALKEQVPTLPRGIRDSLGLNDEAGQTALIHRWQTGTVAPEESDLLYLLQREMAAKDENFRQELLNLVDKNVRNVAQARGLSPFDLQLKDVLRQGILFAANLESLPFQVAMEKRERKEREHEEKIARKLLNVLMIIGSPEKSKKEEEIKKAREELKKSVEKELSELAEELEQLRDKNKEQETEDWLKGKKAWIRSVSRLAEAVQKSPCDHRLRAAFAQRYELVMDLAERQKDNTTMKELQRIRSDVLDVIDRSSR